MLARPLPATRDVSRAPAAVAASITSGSAAVSTRDTQRHAHDPARLVAVVPRGLKRARDPLVVWSFMTQIIILDGADITIQRVRQQPSGLLLSYHNEHLGLVWQESPSATASRSHRPTAQVALAAPPVASKHDAAKRQCPRRVRDGPFYPESSHATAQHNASAFGAERSRQLLSARPQVAEAGQRTLTTTTLAPDTRAKYECGSRHRRRRPSRISPHPCISPPTVRASP